MKVLINLMKSAIGFNCLRALFDNDTSNIVSKRGWVILSDMDNQKNHYITNPLNYDYGK